jgi:hypothetical protein
MIIALHNETLCTWAREHNAKGLISTSITSALLEHWIRCEVLCAILSRRGDGSGRVCGISYGGSLRRRRRRL